jgi:hypothetical protein
MSGGCALFYFWSRRFWRRWIFSIVLVMFGLLLQGTHHRGEIFSLYNFFSFFFGCVHLYYY